jgi:hypothetical protein
MHLRKAIGGLVMLGVAASGVAAPGQGSSRTVPLTVEAGVPLRVELVKRLRIRQAGAPVEGRLLDPVYVFDRMVIPAGSEVEGRVTRIDPVPRGRRIRALANGNFTPFRTAHIEFQSLVLTDGERLPIDTEVSPGAQDVVQLVAGGSKKPRGGVHARTAGMRRQIEAQKQQTLAAIKAPGKLKRLEAMLSAQLPFHRQSLAAGTRFVAELKRPLAMGTEQRPAQAMTRLGSALPPGSVVEVWLKTPLNSARDHQGTPVEAVVARPVFAHDHQLVLPEGSRLEGSVTESRPARRLGRNGRLRFTFRRIELPHGAAQDVEAGLEGVEVPRAAHLKLDSEGGARAVSSKKRLIVPAIEVLLATSSFDAGDSQQRALQESANGDAGNLAGGAVRGGAGLGLLGSVIGLAAHSRPVSAGFAIYGAAWSVYSHVVARGSDVVFPRDTAMEIRFGRHETPLKPPRRGKRFLSSARAGHPERAPSARATGG